MLYDQSDSDVQNTNLEAVLADYLAAEDAGCAPDPSELLRDHPELSNELRVYFANRHAFDQLASGVTSKNKPASKLLGPFGDYELLEQIACGGMGIVYKARHMRLHRTVALKMIRASRLASTEDLQRFRNEAEAAAGTDHPNIVPIYEVGEQDGQPFFTMKLIEGESLAAQLSRGPAEPRQTAHWLAIVARAVHHAHQRGILHRDLKPANILLDSESQPYVTDFGLAKFLTEQSELTQSGAVVGTPSYMAPEQAAGHVRDVTTVADVYSLGAILYALLAGRPVFRGDTLTETLRQVMEQEPISASKLNRNVDRDLATICAKCLEKSPERRYSSAAALADDLERWLAHLPIRARPSNAWQQTWKWAKRCPAVAALLSVSCLATVTLFGGSLWYNQRLQTEIATTQQQRQRAELKSQRAREAVSEMVKLARTRLPDGPEMSPVREALLEKALRFYQEVLDDPDDHPSVRAEKGHAYLEIAQFRERERNGRNAIGVFEQLVREFPEVAHYRSDLAMAHYRLAFFLAVYPDRSHDTQELCREAIRWQEQLVAEFPKKPEYRFDLAQSLNKLGYLSWSTGDYSKSEQAYRRALTITDELSGSPPDRADPRLQRAAIWNSLGLLLRTVGRLQEAQQSHETALAMLECLEPLPGQRALAEGRSLREPARTHLQLGLVLQLRGQTDKSETELRKALVLWEEIAASHPSAHNHLHEVAYAEHALGSLLASLGRNDEAERSFMRAVEIHSKLLAEFPKRNDYRHYLARTFTSLGTLLEATDRWPLAERHYQQALELERTLTADFPSVTEYQQQLADIESRLAGSHPASNNRP